MQTPVRARSAAPILAVLVALTAILGACAGPGEVVERAVEAARAHDRAAYAACFTERSRPILEVFWQATDLHNPPLGKLGATEVTVESVRTTQSRDFHGERAVVTIVEGGSRMRLVLHRTGSTWRIDLLDTEKAAMGAASF